MKLKKYLLPVIFCVISNVAFGKALVFKSLEVERLENQNQAQQIIPNSLEGAYNLSNVNTVKSRLELRSDGSFSWFMNYKKTNLSTTGYWSKTENEEFIELNTNPYPEDIPFIYKGDIPANQVNQSLSDGGLLIQVGYFPDANIIEPTPLKNIVVVCEGIMRKKTVETNQYGIANCNGAGLPLKSLTIYTKNLPNRTVFNNPNFKGRYWRFSFDYMNAHTDYAFVKEKMQITPEGTLIWYPNSLKANSIWEYKQF